MQVESIQGVIFDVDGFVLDTMPDLHTTFERAVREHTGMSVDARYMYSLSGLNGPAIHAKLETDFGHGFPSQAVLARQDELVRDIWETDGINCKPGMRRVLDMLDRFDTPIAAGSGQSREATEFKLKLAGIAEQFAAVVGGDEVAREKPDPETFIEAQDRMVAAHALPPATPRQALLAGGDHAVDVGAANAGGMQSIYVPETGQYSESIARVAKFVFESLVEALPVIQALVTGRR